MRADTQVQKRVLLISTFDLVCIALYWLEKLLVVPRDQLSLLHDRVGVALLIQADLTVIKRAHPPARAVLSGHRLRLAALQLLVQRMPAPAAAYSDNMYHNMTHTFALLSFLDHVIISNKQAFNLSND